MIKTMTALTAVAGAVVMLSMNTAYAGHCGSHDDMKAHDASHAMEAKQDIVAIAAGNDDFSTLVAAVQAAGLVETLQGDGPYTVFAPTNEAFAKLPEGTVENLLKPENRDQLIAILTYHVVPGEVSSAEVVKISEATTVQGSKVEISTSDAGVKINEAKVVAVDIDASNGVIHVIDTVIIPQAS